MKKLLIPAFCLLHMSAIFWWTLPYSFGNMILTADESCSLEATLFKWAKVNDNSTLDILLQQYIDATGSQQYWDFFAPQSPKYHQYLSVCDALVTDSANEKIACLKPALFSNLTPDFATFKRFGSGRSRLYRLTENLINLEDPQLLDRFTRYYQTQQPIQPAKHSQALLVAHQFELHPNLKDLPKAGYRMDKVLWGRR